MKREKLEQDQINRAARVVYAMIESGNLTDLEGVKYAIVGMKDRGILDAVDIYHLVEVLVRNNQIEHWEEAHRALEELARLSEEGTLRAPD